MRIVKKDDINSPFLAPLGEIIYEMIGRPVELGGTTNHSFVHVIIPPGKSSAAHFHKISEETYYIMSGLAKMIVDNTEFNLVSGQACLLMPGEIHRIFNASENENLEFLTISAPAWTPTDSYFI